MNQTAAWAKRIAAPRPLGEDTRTSIRRRDIVFQPRPDGRTGPHRERWRFRWRRIHRSPKCCRGGCRTNDPGTSGGSTNCSRARPGRNSGASQPPAGGREPGSAARPSITTTASACSCSGRHLTRRDRRTDRSGVGDRHPPRSGSGAGRRGPGTHRGDSTIINVVSSPMSQWKRTGGPLNLSHAGVDNLFSAVAKPTHQRTPDICGPRAADQ